MRLAWVTMLVLAVLAAGAHAQTHSAKQTPAARFVAALEASVHRSHAEILVLTLRHSRLRLDVAVPDPAAYLRYRYGQVVEKVSVRPLKLQRLFLQVHDSVGHRVVFSLIVEVPSVNGTSSGTTSWKVAPDLLDCARYLPLSLEIDIERQAPPCPA